MTAFDVNYNVIGKGIVMIALLLIGFYVGGIKPKKEIERVKQEIETAKSMFLTCANYCNALNEIGYIRHEPSDEHYKCFCYSDELKRMEER